MTLGLERFDTVAVGTNFVQSILRGRMPTSRILHISHVLICSHIVAPFPKITLSSLFLLDNMLLTYSFLAFLLLLRNFTIGAQFLTCFPSTDANVQVHDCEITLELLFQQMSYPPRGPMGFLNLHAFPFFTRFAPRDLRDPPNYLAKQQPGTSR